MIRVTETIKKIIQQKDAKLLEGPEAMRQLLSRLREQVARDLGQAALGSWDSYSLKQTLYAIERRLADYDLSAKKEISGQVKSMWDLGQESVYKPLNEGGIYTGFNISRSSLAALENFAIKKIGRVNANLMSKIETEIHLGILGKSPQQVSKAIGAMLPEGPLVVKGRTIFTNAAQRAEFITKTEMGRVFSEAANLRRAKAAEYVDDLLKVWRHGHPKVPRPTHLAADGVAVPENKPFPVRDKNGYQLMRPLDPNADFSEVANCKCYTFTWAKRWGEVPKAA